MNDKCHQEIQMSTSKVLLVQNNTKGVHTKDIYFLSKTRIMMT